jgi:hypothetical protein
VASPPPTNLKALYIGQKGPNAGLIYDIANGHHATLSGGTWGSDSGLLNPAAQCLIFNGTSDYATLPVLIGNSDFITYSVTSQPNQNYKFLWQDYNTGNTTTVIGLTTFVGYSYIFDGNNHGNWAYPTDYPQTVAAHLAVDDYHQVNYLGRNSADNTIRVGLPSKYINVSQPLPSGANTPNISTNAARIGAPNATYANGYWAGSDAIYLSTLCNSRHCQLLYHRCAKLAFDFSAH